MSEDKNSVSWRRERFRELCLSGATREAIAAELAVSPKHVRKYAKELNLPTPPFQGETTKPVTPPVASLTPRSKLWDESRTSALRALWGVSALTCEKIAQRINEEFGASFSKNSVIGKSGRLGLPARAGARGGVRKRKPAPEGTQTSAEARREFAEAKSRAEIETARRETADEEASIAGARREKLAAARMAVAAKTAGAPTPAPEVVPVPRQVVLAAPESQSQAPVEGVTLLKLNADSCRWPLGEKDEFASRFCGNRSADGLPYCELHSRIAYQPALRRRQRLDVEKTSAA
jgi:GcrA cell cycle regulator